MKSFFLKPLLIIFGIVLFPFVHPTGSVAQVAEEQFINGDALPDAPELALRGEYKIGVRTIEVIHKNQIDILNVRGGVEPVYDRKLKLEVWYPAALPAGAGYSSQLVTFFGAMAGGSKAIEILTTNNSVYQASRDPRIKAVVAFAPWGMERGVWDAEGLKGLKVPVFFVAGSQDDVSGYEKGTKAIYNGAVNSDRYLLTYVNARHNVAPNSPPKESLKPGLPFDFYYHYAEPVWDQRRINNINQHFVTAFLGIQLKKKEYSKYLDFDPNIKTWPGFKPRTSVGLELVHSASLKPE